MYKRCLQYLHLDTTIKCVGIVCSFVVCYVGDNIDIDSESRNITFERGIRTLGVNISINDDDILEPLESVRFVLQVLQEFRDIGVRIGFISEAIGNIIDDEGTCIFSIYVRMSKSFMVNYSV